MITRLDDDVRHAVLDAATSEARRLGDARIGTHHLLLGLLDNPDSLTSHILQVDRNAARDALTELDRMALTAIGIEARLLDQPTPVRSRRRPPLTSGARAALKQSVDRARTAGDKRVSEHHLLRGLLEQRSPDPAADLLAQLDVDRDAALDRLDAGRWAATVSSSAYC